MKNLYLFFFLFPFLIAHSQEGFKFPPNQKKVTVPFQLSNNLILMPVEVNGIKLNFLLDTGVEKTVLFSLEDTDSLLFNNVEKIKVRGLGSGKSIDALHSKANKFVINGLVDESHDVYIILDQDLNFSSQLGVPVHGILGYHFFKNNFVEINYNKKKLYIHKNKETFSLNKLKKYDEIPISIEVEKPYIYAYADLNSKEIRVKLLLDTGGSDALWLFEDDNNIKCPPNYFEDFLGTGFSGNIFGKRSRIDKILIGKHDIINPTISFPETSSLQNVSMVEGRNGSVAGEIFKRFDVIFDYENKKMYLKKNTDFNDPFNYNMSGIDIQHNGLQWVKEELELKTRFVNSEISVIDESPKAIKYQFLLKPVYEISHVRANSPAGIVGLRKGDLIIRINGSPAFKYKLQQINDLMQSGEGKTIAMEVERKGVLIKVKFKLKKIL